MALQDSLSKLAGTSLEFVQARLELIALDLEDGAWQFALLLAISLMAALSVVLATVFASLAFVFAFWQSSPVWALGIVGLCYLAAGSLLVVLVVRRFKRSSFLLSDSIQVIREDRQMFRDLVP